METESSSPRVGVLALQGAFREHKWALERLGVSAPLVLKAEDLAAIDALIIPGGESTTIGRLLNVFGLMAPLLARVAAGLPVFGTCAGMVLLAREIEGSAQPRLGVMDVTVRRNAFGRQVDSFEVDLTVSVLGPPPFRGVFIRAPYITRVGPGVEVLACLAEKVILVRQGRLLAASFHPELTDDLRLHRYFVNEVAGLAIPADR
ncbi:pyridoxal phosphate synthase yaaE subunit [Thermodesulfitimonas autotrophica]|uniref:Pyridoxal 5'-phosphate synthase subunit PdxT n=1 Tax=Thermodesulfitimonas autotrophica TaxID=1894989 RepID=A0A3N5BGL7_9THEO|nr:pyridoxal phosphate synthase yaaE subunit [Thermodesulfitimonas autotrophica]